MNRLFAVALACCLLGFVPAASSLAVSAERCGAPGSFLEYNAGSGEALATQLVTNKIVAERYAKHFGTSSANVAEYFRKYLTLCQLDKPYKGPVYFITWGSSIQRKTKTLPVGRRVFVLPDGQPILDAVCGNPLVKFLPVQKTAVTPEVAVAPSVMEVAALPQALVTTQVEMLPAAVPITAAPGPVAELLAGPPVAIPPVLSYVLPMLVGAVSVRTSKSPPLVPEPGGIAALGFGCVALGVQTRKLKRRRT